MSAASGIAIVPGDETVDGSPIAFTLPEDERFAAAFMHYLLVSRQWLLQGPVLTTDHLQDITGPLWVSTRGSVITPHAFYYAITRISDALPGAPLCPHLLIEKIRLVLEGNTLNIELFGELAALKSLAIGPNGKHPWQMPRGCK